jgi:hypothetical protein
MHLFSVSRKTLILLSTVVILLSIPITTQLVQQKQDIREKAQTNSTSIRLMDGTFIYASFLTTSEIPKLMAEISQLGMNTIIIQQTRIKSGGCNGTYSWESGMPSKLNTILSAAQDHQIDVYVGLVSSYSVCNGFYNEPNRSQDTDDAKLTVNYVETNYGNYRSLAGWYITVEPSLALIDDPNILNANYAYYKSVVGAIKQYSSKPVIVSPILGGSGNKSPSTIAQRALDLQNVSGVDIQAWQDSVGGYSTPIGWDRGNPTYQLNNYFDAISNAIGRKSFWANTELFSCPYDHNTLPWGIGGCDIDWNLYRPASVSRIINQVNLSTSASKNVSWIQQTMMGIADKHHMPEAQRLYDSYRAINGLSTNQYLQPTSYTWITPPSDQYPDTNNKELFDGKTADPRNYSNTSWIGVGGNAQIVIDFDKPYVVDWVATHILQSTPLSIYFPNQLSLECSSDRSSWYSARSWNLPVPHTDADYVFSNPDPLRKTCKYLRLTLHNTAWTFLSEIEIVGFPPESTPTNTPTLIPTIPPPTDTPTPTSTPTPDVAGDGNRDGVVNIDDYVIWLNNYQEVLGGNNNGDYYPDDFINGLDYIIWLNNYGN